MIVIIVLSLFFLYLLMFSGSINRILPCSVQNFIKNNIIFRHMMIFSTIYFFTFVLDWYTPNSVFSFSYSEKDKSLGAFYQKSIAIYLAFLITSCLNKNFLIVSFAIMFIFLNVSIYRNYKYKNDNQEICKYIKCNRYDNTLQILRNFKNIPEKMRKLDNKYYELFIILLIEDILKIMYVLVLVVGFIYNFVKMKKKYKNKFKFYEFIFSIRKC